MWLWRMLLSSGEGFAGLGFLNMADIAETLRQDGEVLIPPLGVFNTQSVSGWLSIVLILRIRSCFSCMCSPVYP
jgi:hypothetical protein